MKKSIVISLSLGTHQVILCQFPRNKVLVLGWQLGLINFKDWVISESYSEFFFFTIPIIHLHIVVLPMRRPILFGFKDPRSCVIKIGVSVGITFTSTRSR
jgi:hypothetical protein